MAQLLAGQIAERSLSQARLAGQANWVCCAHYCIPELARKLFHVKSVGLIDSLASPMRYIALTCFIWKYREELACGFMRCSLAFCRR